MFCTRLRRLSWFPIFTNNVLLGIVLVVLSFWMLGGCRGAADHVMSNPCSSLYKEEGDLWLAVDSTASAELGSEWRSRFEMSCEQSDSLLIVHIVPPVFSPDGSMNLGGNIEIGWNPRVYKVQYVVRGK